MPDFFAMDISIDLRQANGEPLVPFYHYETGGCNADGIMLNDSRNDVPCTAGFDTPW